MHIRLLELRVIPVSGGGDPPRAFTTQFTLICLSEGGPQLNYALHIRCAIPVACAFPEACLYGWHHPLVPDLGV
jgi:hypothetical protein